MSTVERAWLKFRVGPDFLSIARDVPLSLINSEHLISALRGSDSLVDNHLWPRHLAGRMPASQAGHADSSSAEATKFAVLGNSPGRKPDEITKETATSFDTRSARLYIRGKGPRAALKSTGSNFVFR